MVKKIIFCILLLLSSMSFSIAYAQEGGNVYLDLKDDEELEKGTLDGFTTFIRIGKNYIDDVVDYDDLLEGDAIKKDFSDDFKIKYKNYNEKKAEEWEKYVRKGVEAYRWFKDVKKEITSWLMKKETALIVAEDQYEMGDDEEYIESDKPLVVKDFKKVVAYSNAKRDKDAVLDKLARDKNIPTPSDVLNKYKKMVLEKDWSGIIKSAWNSFKKEFYDLEELNVDSKKNRAKSVVLPEYEYVDENGKVKAVVLVEVLPNNIFLFNRYKDYEGIK